MGKRRGGIAGWTLDATFGGVFGMTGSFDGAGSGTFMFGADTLLFTFTSHSDNAATMPLTLTYSITGGTGLYAGHVGSGTSVLQLLGNPAGALPINYVEQGAFVLAPVPEPGSALLLALGVAAVAGRRGLAGRRTA